MATEAVCPVGTLNVFGVALKLLNACKVTFFVTMLLFFIPSLTVKLIERVSVSGVTAVLL
ncbi:hypothetical protein D3C79_1028460 [compost metagenome]